MTSDFLSISRILILDDDDVMRDLLEALLTVEGYVALTASSGQEAIALLGSQAVRFVLTDLQMPGLEGEALARALRSAMPSDALLIGMSGAQPTASILPHLDAFLSKPFNMGQFAAARKAAEGKKLSNGNDPAAKPVKMSLDATTLDAAQPTGRRAVLDETIFTSLMKMVPMPQLLELYKLTLSDVSKRHERMTVDAETGNLRAVQREAHAIKGGCGMVGALELADLAAAAEGGTTLNTYAIAEIPSACVRLRRMLDAKLQTA